MSWAFFASIYYILKVLFISLLFLTCLPVCMYVRPSVCVDVFSLFLFCLCGKGGRGARPKRAPLFFLVFVLRLFVSCGLFFPTNLPQIQRDDVFEYERNN